MDFESSTHFNEVFKILLILEMFLKYLIFQKTFFKKNPHEKIALKSFIYHERMKNFLLSLSQFSIELVVQKLQKQFDNFFSRYMSDGRERQKNVENFILWGRKIPFLHLRHLPQINILKKKLCHHLKCFLICLLST